MLDGQEAEIFQLVQKAKNGDVDAFGQLYECYAPRLFRYLFAHLDDRLDAEDLTGEIFLRVWRSLPDYRQKGIPFGGFLFRVARNALVDHYRKARHRRQEQELADDLVDGHDPGPAQAVAINLECRQIRQAMRHLREHQRTVLSLRFFAELSIEETAQAMGKSKGAVRVLQHRALSALREQMSKMTKVEG
jgi:RNA polymerase sigma-70 factor, ECF subfamily